MCGDLLLKISSQIYIDIDIDYYYYYVKCKSVHSTGCNTSLFVFTRSCLICVDLPSVKIFRKVQFCACL